MIQLFTGNPGGGKSYDVVRNRFIPAFKSGRKIFTNLDGLNLDYICAVEGIEEHYKGNVIELVSFIPPDSVHVTLSDGPFVAEYIPHVENMEPGAKKEKALKFLKSRKGLFRTPSGKVVCSVYEFYFFMSSCAIAIIDESQNYWSAKDWSNVDISLDYYLSMHRHYGHDIAFISQKAVRVYKEIQRLSEYVWIYEKLGWLGLPGRYKASCQLGVDEKRTFARHVRRYDKKYFPCYKSFATSDIKEQRIESAKMFSPGKIAVVSILLVFFFMKFINMPWFHGGKRKDNSEALASIVPSFGSERKQVAKDKVSNPVVYEEKVEAKRGPVKKQEKPKKRDTADSGVGRSLVGQGPIIRPLDDNPHDVSMHGESVVQVGSAGSFGCSDGLCYKIVNGEVVEFKL